MTDERYKTLETKATQLLFMVKDWSLRWDAAMKNPQTTEEEFKGLMEVAVQLMNDGLDLGIPHMDDKGFPEPTRELMLTMMANIPVFKEIHGIE